jgi:hypothetical protein
VAGGPKFGAIDGDFDVEEAIGEIEASLGIRLDESFWQTSGLFLFGEFIDRLLDARTHATLVS